MTAKGSSLIRGCKAAGTARNDRPWPSRLRSFYRTVSNCNLGSSTGRLSLVKGLTCQCDEPGTIVLSPPLSVGNAHNGG